MALSNFLVTVVGVGAIVLMLRGDVRKSSVTLRRNLRHIREWLETEQVAASKGEPVKPKEMEAGSIPSEKPPKKEEKVH
ncbi:hypothetical protein MPTK1_2g19800 [Marchantia polymorpha subsp. ruderalis]|uniref:Uncharacterized protein n=1 Tax=Marchantia polymorpha TaxID=3197 RepID=A0A2R6WVC1_MARPO|nr:hypothetical protein MARPO_0055s0070 [Marchantia polymorpha]BBN02982.1 hypothetical protein Mp_2g19800 [Marchantia polymorpha subsp. ruderalis]|eukprot:PTQ37807.1 hypothetical protein MARPO_0055s0070 [Marchantia polymorpha]